MSTANVYKPFLWLEEFKSVNAPTQYHLPIPDRSDNPTKLKQFRFKWSSDYDTTWLFRVTVRIAPFGRILSNTTIKVNTNQLVFTIAQLRADDHIEIELSEQNSSGSQARMSATYMNGVSRSDIIGFRPPTDDEPIEVIIEEAKSQIKFVAFADGRYHTESGIPTQVSHYPPNVYYRVEELEKLLDSGLTLPQSLNQLFMYLFDRSSAG
ncbi:MAG: hypothetical protein AAGI23_14555 [Bacteroidota bacterium]